MYSLTAEEQWKILQKEERRKGRGRRKKKTLMEQLRDMDVFGHDPDSEEELRKDLERVDTRGPFKYSGVSVSDSEESSEEDHFWDSRRKLFNSWIFQASRPSSWIEEKDLPLLFRFALHMPRMHERNFRGILRSLNVQLELRMGDVRRPNTRPVGRSRRLMFGIDYDEGRKVHPSSTYGEILPKGATEDTDAVREEAAKIIQQDDEDIRELTRRQLWTVYEHVQNGSVSLDAASWHYRDAFNTEDMSDEALVICLQHFDIPTDHNRKNEQDGRRGSAHSLSPRGVELSGKEVTNIDIPNAQEAAIVDDLAGYIRLYRDGPLQEHEVIPMIQDCLAGFELHVHEISDILTDFEKDVRTAALLMWKDAWENEDSSFSSSSSSSEEENEESDEEQAKPLSAVMVPDSRGNDKENHGTAVPPPADGSNSPNGLMTEGISHRDATKENERDVGRPLMSPTAIPPGTPRPKHALLPAATEKLVSQTKVESDREPPRDRENLSRRRLSSPDDGMTAGIWGLLMPTKEARKYAYEMRLPQDTIDDQVRSISPRRFKRRKADYAKTIVTFPKSKRKASMTLHGDTPFKSPKHGDHSDIFATEGEDQETFVLSHFDRDAIVSADTCTECLRFPCKCVYKSSSRSGSEPECPKCVQKPCVCGHLADQDEAIPGAPPDGRLSFNAPRATTSHRTRPEPPKQSVAILGFLARVLDDDDVLGSIRELKRLFPADSAVADVKTILRHINKAKVSGEKLHDTGIDDQEATHILYDLVESSPTLIDFCSELRENHLEGVREDPDIDSSLLNSSFDNENVPTSPPNPGASPAAFPEIQPDIANVPVIQANNKLLASDASPYLSTTAPNSSASSLGSSGDIENAAQSSRFQTRTIPDSSAAGDPSRAEPDSGSPARGELSTAGGPPSRAVIFSGSPATGELATTGGPPSKAVVSSGSSAGSPSSSSADFSEQVSEHPVDAEGDAERDTWGAPLKRQSHSALRDADDSEVERQPPPSPRPGAKQLPTRIPPPSPRPKAKQLPTRIPPPSPRPGAKQLPTSITPPSPRPGAKQLPSTNPPSSPSPSFDKMSIDSPPPSPRPRPLKLPKKMNATAQSCLKSPISDSIPSRRPQPRLPEKAGNEWMSLTPMKALEYAKDEAFSQRKSLTFYLEERRAVRLRIKKKNDYANSRLSYYSFFQSSNGVSGSSGSTSTTALNRMFDKYRGSSDISLPLVV